MKGGGEKRSENSQAVWTQPWNLAPFSNLPAATANIIPGRFKIPESASSCCSLLSTREIMVKREAIFTTSNPMVKPLNTSIPHLVLSLISGYIPKKEHAIAACVSKEWKFALSPPEWAISRSSLCLKKEQSLYIRIKINSCHQWYILNENRNPRLSINPDFFTTPFYPEAPSKLGLSVSALAVLGSKIYIIGGTSDGSPINKVWSFDCASSTIKCEPKMLVGRESSVAEVVNGIIYVMGGRLTEELDENLSRDLAWIEKLDPDTGLWEVVSCPFNITKNRVSTSCVVDGRIYAWAFNSWIVFSPIKGEWSIIESKQSGLRWRGKPAVLDGVIYFQQFSGYITGYNVEKNKWKKLKVKQWKNIEVGNNMKKLMFPKFLGAATIAALNGNLYVLYEKQKVTHEHVNEKQEIIQGGVKVDIMCVAIEVSKGSDGGLNGLVLWVCEILQLPYNSSAVHCLSVYV